MNFRTATAKVTSIISSLTLALWKAGKIAVSITVLGLIVFLVLSDYYGTRDQPTPLEKLCADLEGLSDQTVSELERRRIDDVRLTYCAP
jgi:hypothetical protein